MDELDDSLEFSQISPGDERSPSVKACQLALDSVRYHNLYVPYKEIGSGAFSKVYLAKCQGSSREMCAIKMVENTVVSSSEIFSGMTLHHPNIVRMLDWFSIGPNYYLVYEYLNGEDLEVMLHRIGLFTEEKFRIIFTQILSAVMYCHQIGVVHRDIKMENIVAYGKNRNKAKLIDFGFAFFSQCPEYDSKPVYVYKKQDNGTYRKIPVCVKSRLSDSNRCLGTVEYCAPEILLGCLFDQSDLPGTDIYSLGVVMYCCLVGQFPRGDSFFRFAATHRIDLDGEAVLDPFQNPDFCYELLKRSQLTFARDRKMQHQFEPLSNEAKDLMISLLHPIPSKRVRLEEIPKHPWITNHSTCM
jgi:serine/threonine protein kinase